MWVVHSRKPETRSGCSRTWQMMREVWSSSFWSFSLTGIVCAVLPRVRKLCETLFMHATFLQRDFGALWARNQLSTTSVFSTSYREHYF
jgi:hypothetical protein